MRRTLIESRMDVTDASVYSGICTEIFKQESVIHQRKVYSFIHLSVQEFLAAFYWFHCCTCSTLTALEYFEPLYNLLKGAVDKALLSKTGHLDLFLRFLLGISLGSNQRLLQDLLTHTVDTTQTINTITLYIKDKIKHEDLSADSSINLFLCLLEVKDQTLYREIEEFVRSDKHSEKKLSAGHCSAIAYMLQMSEEVMDEFDLKKYNTTQEGRRRLIPAVNNSRRALLPDCNLMVESCKIVSSALQSSNSPLRELDMSNNDLQDSGVKLISDALKSHNCQLEILSLDYGGLCRVKSGLQKYFCDLTLDPNTVNTELILSEENKKVTHVKNPQPYPDHPDRFEGIPQVLSKESLTGRCYWEAQWEVWARIAVSYKGTSRKEGTNSMFGLDDKSWSLFCNSNGYNIWHKNKTKNIPAPSSSSKKVGVYLDVSAGTLSFYSVSDT
ncbi:hypothetical protein cypCar_00038832, partial [Cyprinus carpio]